MKKKKYDALSDPGHAWVSIPLKDIVELGIQDQISSSSYMKGGRAYLEEDADLSLFMEAAKKAGWDVTLKSKPQAERASRIRSYGGYDAGFAEGINIGDSVYIGEYPNFSEYRIEEEDKESYKIARLSDDSRYRLPKKDMSHRVISQKKKDLISKRHEDWEAMESLLADLGFKGNKPWRSTDKGRAVLLTNGGDIYINDIGVVCFKYSFLEEDRELDGDSIFILENASILRQVANEPELFEAVISSKKKFANLEEVKESINS